MIAKISLRIPQGSICLIIDDKISVLQMIKKMFSTLLRMETSMIMHSYKCDCDMHRCMHGQLCNSLYTHGIRLHLMHICMLTACMAIIRGLEFDDGLK